VAASKNAPSAWRLPIPCDAGLAAIAADVGYATEFAFSRAFRRAFGEPPGKYRERMRANARSSSMPRF
jgi:AraC-like DNA-binding protein